MYTTNKTRKASTKNSSAASNGENKQSAQDKALDRFAEMMIEKIEAIQQDWKKPWFTEGTMQWLRPHAYAHCERWTLGGHLRKARPNGEERRHHRLD